MFCCNIATTKVYCFIGDDEEIKNMDKDGRN